MSIFKKVAGKVAKVGAKIGGATTKITGLALQALPIPGSEQLGGLLSSTSGALMTNTLNKVANKMTPQKAAISSVVSSTTSKPLIDLNDIIKLPDVQTNVTTDSKTNWTIYGAVGALLVGLFLILKKK